MATISHYETMTTPYLTKIEKRLKDLVEKPTINGDWVFVTMALFRQHIEAANLKSSHRHLNFYCNWLVHDSLGHKYAQELLKKISVVLIDPTTGHPSDRIAEILFKDFRENIRQILSPRQAGIFEGYTDWKSFCELMWQFLLDKPLQWDKQTKDIVIHFFELFEKNGQVWWRIQLQSGEIFEKELMFAQDPQNFIHQ